MSFSEFSVEDADFEHEVYLPTTTKIYQYRKVHEDLLALERAICILAKIKAENKMVYDLKIDNDRTSFRRLLDLEDPEDFKFAERKIFVYMANHVYYTPLTQSDLDQEGMLLAVDNGIVAAQLMHVSHDSLTQGSTISINEQVQEQGDRSPLEPRKDTPENH
jgi:hypothetical protein